MTRKSTALCVLPYWADYMRQSSRLLSFLLPIFVLSLLLMPQRAVAQEWRVSTAEQLQVALAEAKGGTILLAPGNYGVLSFKNQHFLARVILRSYPPRKAVFDRINLVNSGNLGFEGLTTLGQFRAEKSDNLIVQDCRGKDMLYFRNVDGLQIDNCIVSGGQYGILFNSVSNFTLRHTRAGKVSEDVMRITGKSHDGLIEYNILDDVISYPPTHPDLIQFFSARGKTPQRITIRRNLLRDEHETGSPTRTAQGIFVAGPGPEGYRDILIEENMINTRSPNTIYIHAGRQNVVVRNNTLLPGVGDGGAVIRLVGKDTNRNIGTVVEGNIAKLILDQSKSAHIRSNYLYGRGANIPALFSGTGARWQDFLPVLGTGPDKPGLGATAFLRELLAAQKPGAVGGPRLGPDWSE